MNFRMKLIILISCVSTLYGCNSTKDTNQSQLVQIERVQDRGYPVDERSYNLGMLNGFAELIKNGIKDVAFSNSFSKADMDIIYPDVKKIAKKHGIYVYRDPTPLNTKLFSFTKGNEVIVLYRTPAMIEEYLEIKSDKSALIANNAYSESAKIKTARKFGSLLSYSNNSINKMLGMQTDQTESSNHSNIKKTIKDWEKMWNTFDFDDVERLFEHSEKLTYFSSEKEGIIKGIEAVKKHHKGFGFKSGGTFPLTKLWLKDINIVEHQSTASVTAVWYFQRTDGKLQKGPVTVVLKKSGGNYRIAHMNFSNYEAVKLPSGFQAISQGGDILVSTPANKRTLSKLEIAKANYQKDASNLENIIWYGRRLAYAGEYRKAIKVYTEGLKIHADNARLLRHRGHRFISIREFDNAINDFELAYRVIQGTKDRIEEDGLPNEHNIPVSSLHTNIRYHLGLAYYLTNNYEKASSILEENIVHSNNDDNIVSTTHWLYLTLRQLGQEEKANKMLEKINLDMRIIENTIYHQLCLFYKGDVSFEEIAGKNNLASMPPASQYGVGKWLTLNGQLKKGTQLFDRLLQANQWNAFGYIAAESDLSVN